MPQNECILMVITGLITGVLVNLFYAYRAKKARDKANREG
jgi:hypothetical protein